MNALPHKPSPIDTNSIQAKAVFLFSNVEYIFGNVQMHTILYLGKQHLYAFIYKRNKNYKIRLFTINI